MTEGSLRARLDGLPGLRAVAQRVAAGGTIAGVPASAVGLLSWWLRGACSRTVVVVTSEPETVYLDHVAWSGEQGVALFPAGDTLPFDRVPAGEEVTRRRLSTLALLAAAEPVVVVTSPAGLLRPTLPPAAVREGVVALAPGQAVRLQDVVMRLVALGYRREAAVSAAGDFAVRGGILDVFSPDRPRPWRAEWFGDEIEELRAFDVESQTSVAKLRRVSIMPARELDLSPPAVAAALGRVRELDLGACREEIRDAWERDVERLELGAYDEGLDLFAPYLVAGATAPTLFDHCSDCVVLLAGGADRSWRAAERHHIEAEGLRAQEEERGELPSGARSGVLAVGAIRAAVAARPCWEVLRELPEHGRTPAAEAVDLGWSGVDTYAGRFEALAAAVSRRTAAGGCVVLMSRQPHRVEELGREQGLDPRVLEDFDAGESALPDGAVLAVAADLSAGFAAAGAEFYSDHELFGAVKRRGSALSRGARRAMSTSARGSRHASTGQAAAASFALQFAPGDVVVHRDHGIGRFLEMRRVYGGDVDGAEASGGAEAAAEQEYMVLEYAQDDKLFVPVAHLDRVDRYIGGADSTPALSRLGTGEWERTRKRVKERTEEVARELLQLYSERELAPGYPYPPDNVWQQELEASFPFVETPDQELVLEEIKRDMEASRPMDRIVCGDVGFGKTELAMRAAFKVAVEGRQVAMLVPTTVLAQQHFVTFSARLSAFPVTVRQLSRFCTEDDIRATLVGVRSGGVDIVIGTHRLLQKDVVFNNLGLVIIDEEQRFGVLQKERLKQLRVAVDVLSLSATPIPRTLHMSLAGIRDLSVIQTPPEERQPIKTFVTAREESLVREVITRELARGGQVFYVHNRVQTIIGEAAALGRLLPGVRIGIGHGQMGERELATIMQRFIEGEIDVLVCTTIIESGLDIPNANTIIINDAHRFGLAQLYQLRGRVGRAGQRAYAYLLYPPERSLTEKADKRLDVITDLQDLGAGFKLAMRDLEIRGAGNLLGEEQHGEIAAVGLEMYNHLLRQAVATYQGKPLAESPAQVKVSLPLVAYLPPSFVDDERLRLRCYQDLAACVSETELDQRVRGLVDRFGALPPPAEELVYSLRVRLLAAACGAMGVSSSEGAVVVQFGFGHGLDLGAVAAQFRTAMSTSPTRLRIHAPGAVGVRASGAGNGAGRAGTTGATGQWKEVLMSSLRELGRLSRQRVLAPAAAR